MFLVLLSISIMSLLFGYVPESATLMILGIGLIASSIGLRRVLKHQPEKESDETKETV